MSDITTTMRNLPDFFSLNGSSDEEIYKAEKILGVKFSDDYKLYLSEFGVVSANGHEYTGLCSSSRLSVIDVTLYERKHDPDVPLDWYVIEQANIDGIVIWQNKQGEIFQTQPCREPIKIADSLLDYIACGE